MRKQVKFQVVVVALVVCGLMMAGSGCGDPATTGAFAGGLTAGAIAELQVKENQIVAEHKAAIDRLAALTDEAEKAQLEAQLLKLEQELRTVRAVKETVQLGTDTGWDKEALAGYGGSVLAAILGGILWGGRNERKRGEG